MLKYLLQCMEFKCEMYLPSWLPFFRVHTEVIGRIHGWNVSCNALYSIWLYLLITFWQQQMSHLAQA